MQNHHLRTVSTSPQDFAQQFFYCAGPISAKASPRSEREPAQRLKRTALRQQISVDSTVQHCYTHCMLTHNHVWHLHINCDPSLVLVGAGGSARYLLSSVRLRKIAEIFLRYGFSVEPLSDSSSSSHSLTVRHSDAHAFTLLLLKEQLPPGVTIETVV
jgi:hypothetical protein